MQIFFVEIIFHKVIKLQYLFVVSPDRRYVDRNLCRRCLGHHARRREDPVGLAHGGAHGHAAPL